MRADSTRKSDLSKGESSIDPTNAEFLNIKLPRAAGKVSIIHRVIAIPWHTSDVE